MPPKRRSQAKTSQKEAKRPKVVDSTATEDSGKECNNLIPVHSIPEMAQQMDFDTVWQPVQQLSIFDFVSSNVPLKVKEKIWEGHFVDIASLIKSSRDQHCLAENDPSGEIIIQNGKLCIAQAKQEPQRISIEQWTSAFLVYMSVVLEKSPARAQELIKYMRDIRLAASRSPGWWKYDEQFRLQKANNPLASWGVINSEFWLLYVAAGNSTHMEQPQFNRQPARQGMNKKANQSPTCNYFNSGVKCPFLPNCRFSHVCQSCSGNHPKSTCRPTKQ